MAPDEGADEPDDGLSRNLALYAHYQTARGAIAWLPVFFLYFTSVVSLEQALLLGRGGSHWSYFMHTGVSPMEGNTWIDHGDGTFTSDPAAGLGSFTDLDLYMMGLLEPGEVGDFWVVEPDPPIGLDPGLPAEALYDGDPVTLTGRRVDLTVEDVIAAEGLVSPGPETSPKELRMLTLLVVGPTEVVQPEQLEAVRGYQAQWEAAWRRMTRELSRLDFTVTDEGFAPPPFPATPALVPRGAR